MTATLAASPPTCPHHSEVTRLHAQAQRSLEAALHHLSPSNEPQAITLGRALGRAIRATTALKQACYTVKKRGDA